ncbi:sulfotransferase [Paraglaciecola sp.]|uniref:tetratricopeptide repeat-containing sulfotransferase family protein n=1 Tax=Paraglaciecola sp. TaxID=1920173 RepID=UPI0030F460E9
MQSPIQLADNLVKQGHLLRAETLYRELLTNQTTAGSAYLGLGNIALAINQFDNAIYQFNQACHLLPESVTPLLQLATAFNAVCHEQDALTVLNYAQTAFPQSAQVRYQLAQQHIMLGEFALAEHTLRSIFSLNPGPMLSHVLFELVRCQRYSAKDVELLQQRLSDKTADKTEQTVLHYTLGNISHDSQDYPTAWQHFCQANLLQRQSCDFATKQMSPFFAQTKALATPSLLAQQRRAKQDKMTPIFIVGLPRSGSTLLEQMLARHAQISAGGELPYLSREVDQYLFAQTDHHYPYSMQNLSAEHLAQAALIYLTALQRHSRNKLFVIDKLPANFQSIGLIYKLFPKAKVINITRQPAAVAFSIFRNYFAASEPYFCSLTEFKQYQLYYLDLMKHWHSVVPGFVKDVSYEQLIKDPKSTMQSILAFCGIDWDNACLSDTPITTPITTLSNVKARAPIMNSIKKDWAPYQAHLSAFLPSASKVSSSIQKEAQDG